MKKLTLILLFAIMWLASSAQQQTQTFRGIVLDEDSKQALIGASVAVSNGAFERGTTTEIDGRFRIEELTLGRINVLVSYIGYEDKVISGVVLNSAKELVLEIELKESGFSLQEVVIRAEGSSHSPLNDMSILSARSISAEQTSRYAGGFNDPSRITSNFAGVTSTQDGSNDIIIRGNSPKYMQWRLEGVPITNPNHFADQNAVSGVLSALNNNLLGTSDFYTGAFPAEFGNALSGVYDVRLRKGNNEQFEGTASLGLLGTDVTLEGPFSKSYSGSYLVNYRYSTIGIAKDIGFVDFDANLNFQDAAFKVWLPTKKLGSFSLFGLAGKSNFIFKDVDPSLWVTPGDNFMRDDIAEDYTKSAQLFNVGMNHLKSIGPNGYFKTSFIYSQEDVEDEVTENLLLDDDVVDSRPNFLSRLSKSTYQVNSLFNYRLSARHKIRIGAQFSYFNYDMGQSALGENNLRENSLKFDEGIGLVSGFINWKYNISEPLLLIAGLHNSNVLFNNKHTIEPRVSLQYALAKGVSLSGGYGNHSMMESIPHYFYKEEQNGVQKAVNSDLGLLRAHHFVVGLEKQFQSFLTVKLETYYQSLYDIPVENSLESNYATLNEGLEFQYVDLVNEGKGRNYGIELTIERRLNRGFYFLINATRYESVYEALDGIERNTQYNGKYLANFLFGKEFEGWGKKDNQTFAVNGKVFYGGAKFITPLLRNSENALAIDQEQGLFYDHQNAFSRRLDDTYNITINMSYKWNKPKTTHELFLNLNNLTGNEARLSEYYDANEAAGVGYQRQVGFYPDLLYRVYF